MIYCAWKSHTKHTVGCLDLTTWLGLELENCNENEVEWCGEVRCGVEEGI